MGEGSFGVGEEDGEGVDGGDETGETAVVAAVAETVE